MFYPTRQQAIVGGLLAFGASVAISASGALDDESSKTPEKLPSGLPSALIKVTVDDAGKASGMSISGLSIRGPAGMEVESCVVSADGLRKAERGVPPALGDLACIGSAQVAGK